MNRRKFIGAMAVGSITGCIESEGSKSDSEESVTSPTQTQTATPEKSPSSESLEPLEVSVGETITFARLTNVLVDSFEYAKELQFEDWETVVAEEGTFFLLVKVYSRVRGGHKLSLFPPSTWFELVERDNTISPEKKSVGWPFKRTLTHPVSEPLYMGAENATQAVATGWLVFNVPDKCSTDVEITMTHPDNSTPSVIWHGKTDITEIQAVN